MTSLKKFKFLPKNTFCVAECSLRARYVDSWKLPYLKLWLYLLYIGILVVYLRSEPALALYALNQDKTNSLSNQAQDCVITYWLSRFGRGRPKIPFVFL